ncbi:GrpB family protein [Gordonia rhizosphera]|uniref:GrpB family protein n=1 Tax=Gordonia rhizosphera NBRC 16068 TaxID=1108045 RepID=K6WAK0_9ACTN|nr:GrpB family protein [Gordonia rhizosphera]GAB90776.1 hypothetical protein GORHZ_117_00400 [Gordonia rhizosphera NBRC 16068]
MPPSRRGVLWRHGSPFRRRTCHRDHREQRPPGKFVIEVYDTRWPERFAAERDTIISVLDPHTVVRLEHTGSTSVPGLAAKPIIDMLLVVAAVGNEDSYVPDLQTIGYRLAAREPGWYEHRFLTRRTDEGAPCDVNLHVFGPAAAPEIERILAFRDRLRTHAEDRALYERIKQELVHREWISMLHYSNAKSDIVEEVIAWALAERANGWSALTQPAHSSDGGTAMTRRRSSGGSG